DALRSRGRGADPTHRQPVAPHIGESGRVDRVGLRKSREVLPQVGTFFGPATDAEIRMLRLGEQPAVAPAGSADLDHRGRGVSVPVEEPPGDIALESDAPDEAGLEAGCPGDDA